MLAGAPALAFAGCANSVVVATEDLLSGSEAATVWGFALGVALQVAEGAVPGLAAVVAIAQTIVLPILADITAGTATATQVAAVTIQSTKVIVAAGPAVTVRPNTV